MSTGPVRKLVVAGMLLQDDRILISQRTAEQSHPLQWEFPGGKIESGESPEIALVRELREELGVSVRVHQIWDVLFHAYPDFDVLMLIYPCTILDGGEPQCLEVADWIWTSPEEMKAYDILPADKPLIERLLREGAPQITGQMQG